MLAQFHASWREKYLCIEQFGVGLLLGFPICRTNECNVAQAVAKLLGKVINQRTVGSEIKQPVARIAAFTAIAFATQG